MKKTAKRKSPVKKILKKKFPFLPFVFVLIAITGVIVYLVINSSPSEKPKAASTFTNTVDQVIATRGNNLLSHDINLPAPMNSWGWGQHATESTKFKQPSSGSVAPWLVMYRDVSTINTPTNARFNVRRLALWNYQPSNSQWVKLYDGLPQWRVISNPDTASGYTDIVPTIEVDGSYSFAIPTGMVLHMAAGSFPQISQGNGVVSTVEARLLGSAADISAAKAAVAPGSDYRQANGDFSQGFSSPGYYEAGFGHFGALTGDWKAFDMLSSTLTDAQFRVNYPPGLDTVTMISPTPTPLQASTPSVLPSPPLNSFRADYFNNQTLSGTPAYSTNTTVINYNWGTGSPASGVGADHFSARYSGSFSFNAGTYKFSATSDDGVRLYVDGQLVIDAWKDQGPTTYSASRVMSLGNHTVTVEYYENSYGAMLSTNWVQIVVPTQTPTSTPIPTSTASNVFNAQYFNNMTLSGSPVVLNTTSSINYDWGTNAPFSGVAADNFSARWTGSFNFQAGNYTFTATADDGIRVLVDGVKTLDKWIDQGPTSYSFTQNFATAGVHNIVVEYYDHCCGAVAKFGWTNSVSSVSPVVIEAENMQLLSGTYVDSSNNIFTDLLASGLKGRELYSNGTMTGQLNSPITKITVRAKADICDVAPHMVVKIDNATVLQTSVGTKSWADYAAAANLAQGVHAVSVSFDNDGWTACDRNLRVDKVTIQ